MTDRVRVLSPVATYTGPVGEYQFANGKYDGEISEAARKYFEQQGYSIVPLAEALKADADAAKEKAEADLAAAEAAERAADQAPPPAEGSVNAQPLAPGDVPPTPTDQNGGQS